VTVVLTTAGSREEGDRIASALVEERLAACVNVVAPITSVYRWRGVVERAEEVLLIVKTRRTLMARVAARIRELHSYELPEAIALAIEGGSRDYLAWIGGETKTAGTTPRRTR
jgi:periplasmic divalent cation tolerance protein